MNKIKYQDPRWQKKRLEILSRDNWQCKCCGEEDRTLHVHHLQYIKGKLLWEYPDNLLITLCEECHSNEHDYKEGSMSSVYCSIREAKKRGYLILDIEFLINVFTEHFDDRNEFIQFLCNFPENIKNKA